MKAINNTNDYEKLKKENSKHQDRNESVINKSKIDEAFIKGLMSMNFKKCHTICDRYFYFVRGGNDRIGKIE